VQQQADFEHFGREPHGGECRDQPIAMLSATCQNGGGVVDASRTIIANVLTGGIKLMATLNAAFGSRPIGAAKNHGAISASMIGIINDCASRISFTAAPTAANTYAKTR
jgi:hypothetical protein